MKKAYLLPLLLVFACQSPEEKALTEIDQLNEQLLQEETMAVNIEIAQELVEAHQNFLKNHADSAQMPEHLMKLGDLYANALQLPVKGLFYFQEVHREFPDYEKAAVALFYQGFILENQMANQEAAKEVYEEFLRLYPSHELAETVSLSIQQLGIPLEDLIKQFETQQQ
jgi:tetratricopeptide (TPR) repeat protein